jgi:hypothetical protein
MSPERCFQHAPLSRDLAERKQLFVGEHAVGAAILATLKKELGEPLVIHVRSQLAGAELRWCYAAEVVRSMT